jgi:translation elongation factor EF-4
LTKTGNILSETLITSPGHFPNSDEMNGVEIHEPMIIATIIAPSQYLGGVVELCGDRRGIQLQMDFIDETRVFIKYQMPLSEVVVSFYDELKSLSSGFATFKHFLPLDLTTKTTATSKAIW